MSGPSFKVTDLPPKRSRRAFHDGELSTFSLPLKTITPIMGGGAEARKVDRHNPIRVASVRGQLRMWWRALNLHRFPDTTSLKEAEVKLWGGSNRRADGMKASSVSVHLSDVRDNGEDKSDLSWRNKDFYVTWPAQAFNGGEPAERWHEGVSFTLHLSTPKSAELEVRDAVKAWVLFGGYGGRARRGMGSLTINDPAVASAWLPQDTSLNALKGLFESCPDWLEHSEMNARETPSLRGAGLALHHQARENSMSQWLNAISWLNDFRQGQPPQRGSDAKFARVSLGEINRPSISNWPEADKIRRLFPGQYSHRPRHNDKVVWPRASLGLPIQVQFQTRGRQGERYQEPNKTMINLGGKQENRLASPLIIKPLAVGDGTKFVTCALWLNRAFPSDSLGPALTSRTQGSSKASWDELVAPGDQAEFEYLEIGQRAPKGKRLRTAFFEWLKAKKLSSQSTLIN